MMENVFLLLNLRFLCFSLVTFYNLTQYNFTIMWHKLTYRQIQAYNEAYINAHYTTLIPRAVSPQSLETLGYITNASEPISTHITWLVFDQDVNSFWSSNNVYRRRSGKYLGRNNDFQANFVESTAFTTFLRSGKNGKRHSNGQLRLHGEWISISIPSHAQSPLTAYRIHPSSWNDNYQQTAPYSWYIVGYSKRRNQFTILDYQDGQIFVAPLHWKLYDIPSSVVSNSLHDRYYLVINRIAHHGGRKDNLKTFAQIGSWDLYTAKYYVPQPQPLPPMTLPPSTIVLPPTTPIPTLSVPTTWKKGITTLTVARIVFTISFRVKFYDFNNDYPMCITSEMDAFECHGLGPAYGANQGYMGLYLYTSSGVGPYGRGIQGFDNGGWLKSPQKLSTHVWYHVQIVKKERSLSLIVDGLENIEYLDSTLRGDQFVMRSPGRLIVGEHSNKEKNTWLNGEIVDIQIL